MSPIPEGVSFLICFNHLIKAISIVFIQSFHCGFLTGCLHSQPDKSVQGPPGVPGPEGPRGSAGENGRDGRDVSVSSFFFLVIP